ncbi:MULTISPECIES: hypothetical protein, partial [Enterobacteriaceae]
EWVHVQLHQQKGMISLSPPTICNSAITSNKTRYSDTVMPSFFARISDDKETLIDFPVTR